MKIFFENKNSITDKSTIAILGHSNIQLGLNDSLMTKKLNRTVKNYGSGGQSLFWTLVQAKKLKLHGVKNFIICLDEITFTTWNKTYDTMGYNNMLENKYFLSNNDWFFLLKNDVVFALTSLFTFSVSSSSNKSETFKHKPFKDSLTLHNRVTEIDADENILFEFIRDNPDFNFIIIKPPFHPNYYNNEIYKKNSEHLKNKLDIIRKYNNTLVLDYGHLFVDDYLFMDHSHLNPEGALILSEKVANIIIEKQYFQNY